MSVCAMQLSKFEVGPTFIKDGSFSNVPSSRGPALNPTTRDEEYLSFRRFVRQGSFRCHPSTTVTCVPAKRLWDLAAGAEAFGQESWYIRLGRGTALRALNLPLAITRTMEHHARHAPDHYTASQALRFGETRGLRGSVALAREIANGRLGRSLEHSGFWRTVLLFLVAHPELTLEHVSPIVDFIQANKFGGEAIETENGNQRRIAPWPHFSMKGRTLSSILRLVTAWHSDLAATAPGRHFSWRPSVIQGYRFLEKRPDEEHDREWSIHELLDSSALHLEGRVRCVTAFTATRIGVGAVKRRSGRCACEFTARRSAWSRSRLIRIGERLCKPGRSATAGLEIARQRSSSSGPRGRACTWLPGFDLDCALTHSICHRSSVVCLTGMSPELLDDDGGGAPHFLDRSHRSRAVVSSRSIAHAVRPTELHNRFSVNLSHDDATP
jgi:hypothetical protein